MKEKILELRAKGYTYSQIVEELGCSKGTVSYYCGVDQRQKTGERRRDRRSKIRKFIQESKTGKPCADCGEIYPYWIMQFDHLRDKEFTIGNTRDRASLEKLEQEIKKCEIVCANCHANRTHFRRVKSGADVLEWKE